MAVEQTNGNAGGWLDQARKNAKAQTAKDTAVLTNSTGGNAKIVETAPIEAPKPPASATETVLPKQEEVPVAVPPKTSAQKSVTVEDDDTLIQIPGQKPKTVRQYKWELDQIKDLDRRESKLRELENKIDQRLAEPPKPTVEQPVAVKPQRPTPPVDGKGNPFVEGDPEFERYRAELLAYDTAGNLSPMLEPILRELADVKQRLVKSEQEAQESDRTLTANSSAFDAALTRELPFTWNGLSADAQKQVFAKIRETGKSLYGIDIADRAEMRATPVSVDRMGLIIARAFPLGSLPPGYEMPTPSEELLALQRQTGPLVEKQKPDPLPETGVGAVALAPVKGEEKSKGPISWGDKVRIWERASA